MKIQGNENIMNQAVKSGELEIDSEGRIWRLKRKRGNGTLGVTNAMPCKRVRAESMDGFGYLKLKMLTEGRRVYCAAHRLVWLYFKGPIPGGLTINHKNGVKHDNRPDNLETATFKEQTAHAYEVLGHQRVGPTENNHTTTLKVADVVQIRKRRLLGESFQEIARDYKMSRDAVYRICSRKTWTHVPC